MRRFVLSLSLIVVTFALAALTPNPSPALRARGETKRPNILVILSDDLADWHLGCYGNKDIRTPNIDRLAAEGVRMANSFVCTPICSPSRATFFTGRVPRQHGIYDFLTANPPTDPPQGQKEPPPSFKDEVMISDLLSAAGYTCGYIGKWHMGRDESPQHGYKFWRSGLSLGRFTDPDVSVDGVRVTEKGYSTEVFTRYAVEFILERGKAEGETKGEKRKAEGENNGSSVFRPSPSALRPWFLVVSYQNPHLPYTGQPQKYYDMYQDATFESFGIEPKAPNVLREGNLMNDPIGNLRKAAASTTALDAQIPVLLDALEKSGQRRNTLVMFTGDNGFLYGRHGAWSKGHATNPINMYEEVIRVPMIFSFPSAALRTSPGRLPGGRVLNQFVSFYDVLPTLCEAAGINPKSQIPNPKSQTYCGRSYWQVLLGKKQTWENVAYFNFRYTDAVRDERYKLVWRYDGKGPNELFDLQTDPREKQNRIDDPTLAQVRERLRAQLEKWVKRYQ